MFAGVFSAELLHREGKNWDRIYSRAIHKANVSSKNELLLH